MKVSVSYLGVKKKYIEDVIEKLDHTSADFIHVDVKDGHYVKGKANLYKKIKDIGSITRKRLDIHFMVQKPLKMIDQYALLNVFCMTFHLNIKNNLNEVITKCKKYGINVGLALNPEDDISLLDEYLDKIDLVLIMSVKPGLPGQEFIKEVIPKIKELKAKIKKEKRHILISVDGGVNLSNKKFLGDADILVSGSCVTKSDNFEEMILTLKE